VKVWRVDLGVRQAELDVAAQSGLSGVPLLIKRQALRGEQLVAKAVGRWVSIRSRHLVAGHAARRRFDRPWDRACALFWRVLMKDRSWRRLYPQLWDYELAFGPVIDELKPDLIHANDFRMLGVGARAKVRARANGHPLKLVWDAHEFLPGIKPQPNVRWRPAHCAHEREYAPYADAAVTVSESLATLLQERHGLTERPAVILNAPSAHDVAAVGDEQVPDLRKLCDIGPEVPLLMYSGAAAEHRGLGIMIDALPRLEGAHVALVVLNPSAPYVQNLLAHAEKLGVADRVHALPYVPYWQVVPFLSSADAGVIPIHHWPNHEIALITKFFEYSHARLPLIVSDVQTMAETTRSTGQGEVFQAQNLDSFLRAADAVLTDPKRYRAAYERPGLLDNWTWEVQAKVLEAVYCRLLPDRVDPHSTSATDGPGRPSAETLLAMGVPPTPFPTSARALP